MQICRDIGWSDIKLIPSPFLIFELGNFFKLIKFLTTKKQNLKHQYNFLLIY